LLADTGQFGRCPELGRIAGHTPRLILGAGGLVL
jgi:hypothetical protein